MTVRYGINWMGVANKQWYRDRGLLVWVAYKLKEDSKLTNRKAGEVVEYEEYFQEYCCGRIDVRGTGCGPYGEEIGLQPMTAESWAAFGHWLSTFETDIPWSLDQLVLQYEKTNPTIEWWKDDC